MPARRRTGRKCCGATRTSPPSWPPSSPTRPRWLWGTGGTVRAWALTPDPRPAGDLVWLTQVLAGQRLDGLSGGLVPLEAVRLKDAWPRLRALGPRDPAP